MTIVAHIIRRPCKYCFPKTRRRAISTSSARLADALNVDAKWERAVEGVLGSSLQSIVVPTPDDAARAAQWFRENNGGRASFLVAGLHGGSDESNALACKVEERPALSISFANEPIPEDLKIGDSARRPT